MTLTTPQLRDLTAAIDSALNEPVGYIAIEWALRQRGYFISPTFRRSAEEWFEYFRELFPGGKVQVIHKVKPHVPEFLNIGGFEQRDEQAIIRLAWSSGSSWDIDVSNAQYVDGDLIDVSDAHHHEELTLRRSVPGKI